MIGGVYIALGSNLGDREANLRGGLAALAERGDIRIVRVSSFHETEPVGGPSGQPLYLNAAAELETELPPWDLLQRMLGVEARYGRVRSERNGPRTLDLDLLLYGDLRIDEPELTVPHPRMWQRDFVLRPLGEICDIARTAPGNYSSPRCGLDIRR